MYSTIKKTIKDLSTETISKERKEILQPLIEFIQEKSSRKEVVLLNFICTHNSRRSHLSQIWAQVMASYFNVENVYTYSGGTEATALFPVVATTLKNTGFLIHKLSENNNPVYAIKYDDNALPIVGFSKKYSHKFNPISHFCAIMTCSQADEGCPLVLGCEKRVAVTYEDPKAFDNTPLQAEKYSERSLQIATELKYVFQQLKTI